MISLKNGVQGSSVSEKAKKYRQRRFFQKFKNASVLLKKMRRDIPGSSFFYLEMQAIIILKQSTSSLLMNS
jgi:hypothetical protein